MPTNQNPYSPAVKGLIRNSDGEYLLLRRSAQSRLDAGRWDLPGGKCDAGESLDETLRREALEETGLAVEVERFLGTGQWTLPHVNVLLLLFEAETTSDEVTLSDEHDEFVWVAHDEILTYDMPVYIADALKAALK